MYSLMSNLLIASSLSNKNSARALDISVFHTQVGPRNKNDHIGLSSSVRPVRDLLMAFATAWTAFFCHIILEANSSSILINFSVSVVCSLVTGIPVHCDTTRAISCSVTSSWMKLQSSFSLFSAISSSFLSQGITQYCNSANLSKFHSL